MVADKTRMRVYAGFRVATVFGLRQTVDRRVKGQCLAQGHPSIPGRRGNGLAFDKGEPADTPCLDLAAS